MRTGDTIGVQFTGGTVRILLVDDDVGTAGAVQRELKATGAVLEHVETGEEVFQLAKRYDYDALIMDLVLPDSDGYEVIRKLRWASISVPILVLSSLTRPQAKVKAFSLGADDFLERPFDEAELGARIQALVCRSKSLDRSNITPSALTHSAGSGSLSSLARIDAAEAFQMRGLGSALCSAR
jgi:two-component system cell cycle response regulator CtrA